MQSTTGNQSHFAFIPTAESQRSSFDRSFGHKTTLDAGALVPVFIDEALPGDTMNLRMSTFVRMATPIVPLMDNLTLDSFFFSVPVRQLWDHWRAFNGEQVGPDSPTDFEIPQIAAPLSTGWTAGSLGDYFGLPTGVPGLETSALFFRAYAEVFDSWFRDQNLVTPYNCPKDDGPDNANFYPIANRMKRHDFFTSALPWPQKGPAVALPLGTMAPVIPNPDLSKPVFREDNGNEHNLKFTSGSDSTKFSALASSNSTAGWSTTGLVTDLTDATAATINELREAFQIQRLYERDARGGTRYSEIIKSHFQVDAPDMAWRPEYLGGGSQSINITPVPQTQATSEGVTPQANLAAYGTSSGDSHSFVHSFTEHCIVLGLVNIRADLNYQQGINRMHLRKTRFDFYWPALAHLGEQIIESREIYCDGTGDPAQGTGDYSVFGYQERWAEYRYKPSLITGKFRSTDAQTLDVWHLAQKFENRPVLDETFITENVPMARVLAVTDEPQFLFDSFFSFTHSRPMPTYSVPGLIDHF